MIYAVEPRQLDILAAKAQVCVTTCFGWLYDDWTIFTGGEWRHFDGWRGFFGTPIRTFFLRTTFV